MGLPNSGYTPLIESLKMSYDISSSMILFTSTSFLIGNVLFALVFNKLCQNFSIRNLNFIALFIIIIGRICTLFMESSFWLCIIGQFMSGLGACVIIDVQISVAFHWFSKKTRGAALAVYSISNLLGNLFIIKYTRIILL